MKLARPIFVLCGLLGVTGVCAALYLTLQRPRDVVRIGINHSPPYCLIGPDGSAGGFTVEVLTEAARRKGIILQWTVAPEGPEIAFKNNKVDVWHTLADLPDRHRWVNYTDPWLRMKFVMAVPEPSSIQNVRDARGHRIAYTDHLLQSRLVHQFFPQSQLVPRSLGSELSAVCRGEADAAFIDMKEMVARLLRRPAGCESLQFEMIPMDGADYQMAIGASRHGLPAAKALRAEITVMSEDGSLDNLYRKWLRDTVDETRIVDELTQAQERSRLFRYGLGILAAVIVLLVVLVYRERTVRQAIKSAYEFAAAVLDTAGGLVFISDRHGRIVRFNRACERATGKTFEEVHHKTNWEIFVPPDERPAVQAMFAQLAGGVPHTNHEHHWQTLDGERLFSWSNTVLLNEAGRVDYIIATGIDISNREAAEQKLGYEASHDALTNLVNRRQFLRDFDVALVAARAGSDCFTLVIADLDHFKIINDTHGHEAGDDVLVYLARLLRSELAPGDLAARFGGDEFCLLIRSVGVASILDRIRAHLMDHEFRTATGKTFHASVTFGTAAWSDTIHDPVELLRAADQSLYLAKDRSPARLARFESEMAALELEVRGHRRQGQPSQ